MINVMFRGIVLAAAIALLSLPTGCAASPQQAADDVALMMNGSFTSLKQSQRDPAFFEVELHMTPIWGDRGDGPWLYVEQAMATARDKPYRQRVYRTVGLDGSTVRSDVYELPGDPLVFAGAWRDPVAFTNFTPDNLSLRDGCSITLTLQADGSWRGGTDGASCPSSLRGATYATSEVTLLEDALQSWDRGFDANGVQVWGARSGPYEFIKKR